MNVIQYHLNLLLAMKLLEINVHRLKLSKWHQLKVTIKREILINHYGNL